ncbi:MAG TPA: PAS domain S-box protein [Acidimicrobiales bacterium]|nr:PAS domain S-box protein [Acidimicrobiales bacterium]
MPAGPADVGITDLLDRTQQVFCAWDGAGRLLWCNEAIEHSLGFSRSVLIGARIDDLLHPDDLDALVVAPGDDRSGIRTRLTAGDESWRTFEWRLRHDSRRGIVFAAAHDVTDALAAEAEARALDARLREVVAHSPSAIFVQDLEGRPLLANEQWTRLQQSAADLTEAVHLAGTNTEPAIRDVRVVTPEGPRDYMISTFALRRDDGSVFAACGIASDITDRKRAALGLLERERILDTVLKTSPDIISLMDRDGKIHQVSSAEEAILGHPQESPEGRDLFPLVHPDDFDEVASAFIRMVTGSVSTLHLRYRMRHAEGHWVTVDSRGQAVVDEHGSFLGAVVVSRDVSDRLASEEKLQNLRQSAEQASKAKSDFLSRMSHELRTPLNSILGFSQLLQMDDLPMQQADAVEHILRAGRHLLDLIDEVLDIARIESGHLELSIVPVDLLELVRDAVNLTRPMAERTEVGVRVAIDPSAGLGVLADRQRLLQVLLNLISNAVKYNRPGGSVEISAEPRPDGTVRVSVADTGRGIRPEDMDRVFEPFDRLGAEQSGVEGTGVGLSLSRHLVEQMNGALTVESVPEVGSTFSAELPAAVIDPGLSSSGGRRVDPRTGGPAFRVLLVEENLTSLELVERVLARRPGVVVLAAMHGRLGLDLAREHRPDLILVDLHLPDMPGAVLLERLGEDETTAGIPVAVLSAEPPAHQVRRLLGRGVAGHVAKPIDVRALLSLVDAVRAASGR